MADHTDTTINVHVLDAVQRLADRSGGPVMVSALTKVQERLP